MFFHLSGNYIELPENVFVPSAVLAWNGTLLVLSRSLQKFRNSFHIWKVYGTGTFSHMKFHFTYEMRTFHLWNEHVKWTGSKFQMWNRKVGNMYCTSHTKWNIHIWKFHIWNFYFNYGIKTIHSWRIVFVYVKLHVKLLSIFLRTSPWCVLLAEKLSLSTEFVGAAFVDGKSGHLANPWLKFLQMILVISFPLWSRGSPLSFCWSTEIFDGRLMQRFFPIKWQGWYILFTKYLLC